MHKVHISRQVEILTGSDDHQQFQLRNVAQELKARNASIGDRSPYNLIIKDFKLYRELPCEHTYSLIIYLGYILVDKTGMVHYFVEVHYLAVEVNCLTAEVNCLAVEVCYTYS